ASMSARVSARFGTKVTVGTGILIAATGLFYLSRMMQIETPYVLVLIGLCILALGMGTAMSPATNSVMGSVPVNKAGVGSAMNDTTRQLGGAMGVAVLGTIMNATYLSQMETLKAIPVISVLPPEALDAISFSVQSAHIVAERLNLPLVSD